MSAPFPRAGCGAAIVRDGRIFLVLRRRPPEACAWSLPGGKVDFLERVEDAIIREVREETGVQIVLTRPLLVSQLIGADGQHWVSPVYLATIVTGEPENREPEKAAAVAWFAMDDLPKNMAQAAREAIAAILERQDDARLVEIVKARAAETAFGSISIAFRPSCPELESVIASDSEAIQTEAARASVGRAAG